MILPINDTQPNRYGGPHFMVIALILINVWVFFYQMFALEMDPARYLHLFGSVPWQMVTMQGGGALSSLTSCFLHGGFLHLGSNMLFLWVFGRRVEDACGSWRFLCFYLLAGVCADLLSTLVRVSSYVPSIGASGAISGVLGAYLILFPGGRIRTLIFIFVPLWPRIRAFWILALYLLTQLVSAYSAYQQGAEYGTNYWAHLGGFFAGILIFCFLRPEANFRYWNDAPV